MGQDAEKTMAEEKKEWKNWIPTQVLQKAIVVDEGGNVLVLKRSENKPGQRQGKWDLLGGSVGLDDLGTGAQPHEVALAREILEESGLRAKDIDDVCIRSGDKLSQTDGKIFIYAVGFKCKVDGIKPNVVLSDEHTEGKWVWQGELTKIDFGEDEEGFHRQTVKAFLKKTQN